MNKETYCKWGNDREGLIFAKLFVKINPHEMANSLCLSLIKVIYALVANFKVSNMSLNAIRENKILAKFSNLQYIQEHNKQIDHSSQICFTGKFFTLATSDTIPSWLLNLFTRNNQIKTNNCDETKEMTRNSQTTRANENH